MDSITKSKVVVLKKMERILSDFESLSSEIYDSAFSEEVKELTYQIKNHMYRDRDGFNKEIESFIKRRYKPMHFKKNKKKKE